MSYFSPCFKTKLLVSRGEIRNPTLQAPLPDRSPFRKRRDENLEECIFALNQKSCIRIEHRFTYNQFSKLSADGIKEEKTKGRSDVFSVRPPVARMYMYAVYVLAYDVI